MSGLGLAVARGLADAVDATIEVEDTPGGGLTMIVTVPVAGNSTAENIAAATPPYRGRVRDRGQRMTGVLVVDDDRPLARALAINLRAHGYQVTLAHDGRSALTEVTRAHPAVVVLDLGLPDLDGIEVLAGIRGWSAVPVIVLSARSTSAEKVEALDAGADDYVTKPFGMDELLARIRAAVRRGAAVPADERRAWSSPRTSPSTSPPTGSARDEHAGAADAHRMVVAGDPGAAQRANSFPQKQLLTEIWGPGDGDTNPLPARLSRPAPAQTRTGSRPSPLPDHRTGRRLPVPAVTRSASAPAWIGYTMVRATSTFPLMALEYGHS